VSIDVKDMLAAESSLGLTFKTDLFVGKEPSQPDNCVTIFDTPGLPPQLTLEGNVTDIYEYPSIQIRIRNRDYVSGWNVANNIYNSLHGRAQETWNETLYSVIYAVDSPALLDWDENDRVRFVINFNLQRR